MRALHSFLLIILAFATNALYVQGQYIYHNHDQGWWKAGLTMVKFAWPVTFGALAVIIAIIMVDSIWP